MTIWGKLAGAATGYAVGGPLGALLGAVAGHFGVDRQLDRAAAPVTPPERQITFTVGVIALGAKMAKADGVVTRDEIDAFKEVFKVPESEVENVARLFNLAKQDVAGYDSYAGQLAHLFRDNRDLLEDVLAGLFHIASSDGVLHPKEDDYLASVARHFGFSSAEFKTIRARFIPEDKSDPYIVLGVERKASLDEVKTRYRRLMQENHPDRAIARGMPEEFIRIANDKVAAINAAYQEIVKERGA